MLVLAVVGQPCSGKDTLANDLALRGFVHISSGDMIRTDMVTTGVEQTRANTHDFAIEARRIKGPHYPANLIFEKISGDTVISGFRNSAEVNFLKEKFGRHFVLVAIDAPIESRYERAKARGRVGDEISFEQFKALEDIERKGSPETQEVDKVIAMAQFTILNTGTKEELLEKANGLIAELKGGVYDRD